MPGELLQIIQLHCYEKYEFLCRQGGSLTALFFLVDGKLQVDQVHPDGGQAVFSFESPFSIIGDLELLEGQEIIANVQAIEDSHLIYLPVEAVRQHGLWSTDFLIFIIRYLSRKLIFSSRLLAQNALPLENRLARYLLYRMDREGPCFTLENRESIAGILGTSVRHLNRTIKAFRTARVIDLKTKLLSITDLDCLRKIAEKGL